MVPEGGAPADFDLRRVGSKQDGGNGGGGGTALLASAGSVPSLGSTTTTEGGYCWICLAGEDEGPDAMSKGEMIAPCRCAQVANRVCHSKCLARWQLQSAGTRREKVCDFCGCDLPDWKSSLTPETGAQAPAIMNVNFGGTTYSFEVKPGPEGYHEFTEAIRRAFALPCDSELNITFTCDEPSSGSLLTLQGSGAYDAAVHCASVSAARRSSSTNTTPTAGGRQQQQQQQQLDQQQQDQQQQQQGGGQQQSGAGGSGSNSSNNSSKCSSRAFNALGRRLRSAFSELFI